MGSSRAQAKSRPPTIWPTANHTIPYEAVLAATLDPIITIDGGGLILSASDSVQRVFGWTPDELTGRNVSILMPEPHRSGHDRYLAEYLETGRTEHLNRARRLDAVRKDGTRFTLEVSVSRVDVPGETSPLFVGIIRDLSGHTDAGEAAEPHDAAASQREDIRLHELLAEQTSALRSAHLRLRMADRMASIGALAAGLGHDMNNVLLPVRAHLEAARTMSMIPEVRDHIDAVHTSVTYLQQLADGLHFLALDADGEESERSATDLCGWWSQAGPLLTKAVPKHAKVIVSFPKILPRVGVSAHGLTQAVLNLIVNAGEAIPAPDKTSGQRSGQGRVRVWAESSGSGGRVRLCVADNGRGMSAEVQRNALEMFYTTKPRGLGTGLGLPLVARVVSRAGGSLQIDSEPGKGTTVTILLPVADRPGLVSRPIRPRSALITLTDGRAEALIRHLLEAAGIRIAPISDPIDHDIWVLEPTRPGLGDAKLWRARHPHGGLVLLGTDPDPAQEWQSLGPIAIEDRNDLDAIGRALGRAIVGLDSGAR